MFEPMVRCRYTWNRRKSALLWLVGRITARGSGCVGLGTPWGAAHLHGVGRDDLAAKLSAHLLREVALAHARGPRNHKHAGPRRAGHGLLLAAGLPTLCRHLGGALRGLRRRRLLCLPGALALRGGRHGSGSARAAGGLSETACAEARAPAVHLVRQQGSCAQSQPCASANALQQHAWARARGGAQRQLCRLASSLSASV